MKLYDGEKANDVWLIIERDEESHELCNPRICDSSEIAMRNAAYGAKTRGEESFIFRATLVCRVAPAEPEVTLAEHITREL